MSVVKHVAILSAIISILVISYFAYSNFSQVESPQKNTPTTNQHGDREILVSNEVVQDISAPSATPEPIPSPDQVIDVQTQEPITEEIATTDVDLYIENAYFYPFHSEREDDEDENEYLMRIAKSQKNESIKYYEYSGGKEIEEFVMMIRNGGSEKVENLSISVVVDGSVVKFLESESLEADERKDYSVDEDKFTSKHGKHAVEIFVNQNKSVVEKNYDNNYRKIEYEYK